MAVAKRISALVALLVIPAGLAWAGQLLGGHAGSPDVGNASITVSVDPRSPGDADYVPGTHSSSPGPGSVGEPIAPGPDVVPPAPVPTVEPVTPPAANTAPPASPQISDVQRQPLPAPATQWDDDWDDDDDDDWDDDGWDDDDDWDDDDE
jgi:hypothetical protein